ncbi:MAG: NIPSNAP family protein [Rubrivivax sp.]|nr:NIPSNAP family protein [Rubrivivax sp.]
MLVDERTYVIRPGCLARYLAWHLEQALPLMREHLGEPLAYWTGADGELDTFVHQWAYADAADRERRRERLYADARWLGYRRATGEQGWVVSQHNRLLQHVPGVGRLPEPMTQPPDELP